MTGNLEMLALYTALSKSRRATVLEENFQVCRGYDAFNGINISSEMSFLIKEAGRLCDNFASDMFYDLKTLHEDLIGDNTHDSVLLSKDEYHWVVGIRDYGCDHDNFILCRVKESGDLRSKYRAMYEIEVLPEKNTGNTVWFRLNLYPIDVGYLKKVFDEELESIRALGC